MNTLIKNAKILSMDEDFDVKEGEIYIENGRIVSVGTCYNIEQIDEVIDAEGNLIMPGFKNAHSHCPMVFARSLADDLPLSRWLNDVIFKLEAKLTGEDVYWFAQLAYLEYLAGGITSSFNMYYEPQAIVEAAKRVGYRTVLCGAVNNFKESSELLEKYYIKYNSEELVSFQLGFHAEYTTSIELMEKISELAHKYSAPVHVHNSETEQEVKGCLARYGKTPTQLLDMLGIYDFGGSGFHSVFLDEQDIDIYIKRGVSAVINVCSNMKLASGLAPVQKYIERGLMLALGTDGASSNNALDIFREMYVLSLVQKVCTGNPQSGSPKKILEMAIKGGAKAMGLDECDALIPGKKADLIMIDLNQPNMRPMNNIVNNIVYSGNPSVVKMTMINGQVLYKDREYLRVDSKEIIAKVEEHTENLLKR